MSGLSTLATSKKPNACLALRMCCVGPATHHSSSRCHMRSMATPKRTLQRLRRAANSRRPPSPKLRWMGVLIELPTSGGRGLQSPLTRLYGRPRFPREIGPTLGASTVTPNIKNCWLGSSTPRNGYGIDLTADGEFDPGQKKEGSGEVESESALPIRLPVDVCFEEDSVAKGFDPRNKPTWINETEIFCFLMWPHSNRVGFERQEVVPARAV